MKLAVRTIMLVFAALLICGVSVGQQEGEDKKKADDSLREKLAKGKNPVQIEADNLVVFRKEQKIVFTGKVVMKRAPTVIHCRRLTAYYRENDWEVRKAICQNDVSIVHGDTFAKCNKATFDNINGVITMDGAPVIYQGNQIFRGDVLKYYLKDERITGKNVRYQRNPAPPAVAPKNK